MPRTRLGPSHLFSVEKVGWHGAWLHLIKSETEWTGDQPICLDSSKVFNQLAQLVVASDFRKSENFVALTQSVS